jgi:hypothetical protein
MIKKEVQELLTFMLVYDFSGEKIKTQASSIKSVRKRIEDLDKKLKKITRLKKNIEIIICLGLYAKDVRQYIYDKYSKYNIRVVENTEFTESASCESLRIMLNNTINNNIIICQPNASINSKIISKTRKNHTYAVVSNEKKHNASISANVNNKNVVEHFSFGGSQEWKNCLIIREEDLVRDIRNKLNANCCNYKNKFIFEMINDVIAKQNTIKAIQIND